MTHSPAHIPAFMILFALALLAGACSDGRFTVVTFPDGTRVNCEIAASADSQVAGLTTYDTLNADQGMIFRYAEERPNVSFWMPARMKFPIDMIFLDSERKVVFIVHRAQPCASNLPEDCPSYGPGPTPVQYVVEVVAGFCDAHGVRSGDTLDFQLP